MATNTVNAANASDIVTDAVPASEAAPKKSWDAGWKALDKKYQDAIISVIVIVVVALALGLGLGLGLKSNGSDNPCDAGSVPDADGNCTPCAAGTYYK